MPVKYKGILKIIFGIYTIRDNLLFAYWLLVIGMIISNSNLSA